MKHWQPWKVAIAHFDSLLSAKYHSQQSVPHMLNCKPNGFSQSSSTDRMIIASRCHSETGRPGSAPTLVFHFRPCPDPLNLLHVGFFISMSSVMTRDLQTCQTLRFNLRPWQTVHDWVGHNLISLLVSRDQGLRRLVWWRKDKPPSSPTDPLFLDYTITRDRFGRSRLWSDHTHTRRSSESDLRPRPDLKFFIGDCILIVQITWVFICY